MSYASQSDKARIIAFSPGENPVICWHGRFIVLVKNCQKNNPPIKDELRFIYRAGGVPLAIDKYNHRYLRNLANCGYAKFVEFVNNYRLSLLDKEVGPRGDDDAAKLFYDWWKFVPGVEIMLEPEPKPNNAVESAARALMYAMLDKAEHEAESGEGLSAASESFLTRAIQAMANKNKKEL
jgi:hypothetical protein